jgi:phage tail sheath gpL-like
MITFTNIPTTIRTPGVYTEIDNSRALQGLTANPQKALIIGQKLSAANLAAIDTLQYITDDKVANTYFGTGSPLARMCQIFKKNNPNTELHAVAIGSVAGMAASGRLTFSANLSVTRDCVLYLMVNGSACYTELTSGWSNPDIISALKTQVNLNSYLPVHASTTGSNIAILSAVVSGTLGNYINFRLNYYAGQSNPYGYQSDGQVVLSTMEGGATDPSISDAWSAIDNEQYHYIVNPFIDATNLSALENELEDRFDPLEDLAGQGFTGLRATIGSCTTLGNSRNSPFNTILGAYDSPTCPEEWGAALGAVAAWNLNNDPARPLQYLTLEGVLAPPAENQFSRSERDIILYDGIATYITNSSNDVLIERCITTYQTNSAGTIDSSYLDVETLATLNEIRYQYKVRMVNRFIAPRFKLADDSFPVQPGSYIATPKTIKQEIIALFTLLRDRGLIENLDQFITNLIVERDTTNRNMVNALLPADIVNQFRVLSSKISFIL